MGTYSEHEQRILDQQSGEEMDKRAERRAKAANRWIRLSDATEAVRKNIRASDQYEALLALPSVSITEPPRPAPVSGDWISREAAIVALFEADLPYSANEELDKIAARLRALPSVSITEPPRPAPVRFDLIAHLLRQRDWSAKTFGPGPRTKGVVDHIRKELAEIEADPADIMEWVDVVILAFDGAWRAGWEPEAIVAAIEAKQAKNEARKWPDWRTASPDHAIEHDRSTD